MAGRTRPNLADTDDGINEAGWEAAMAIIDEDEVSERDTPEDEDEDQES